MEFQGKFIKYNGILIDSKNSLNGVCYNKYSNKYLVNLELRNKTKALGIVDSLEEGLELYFKTAKKYKTSKIIKYWEQKSLF